MQNEQMTVPPFEGHDLNKTEVFGPVSLLESPDDKGDLHIHLNGAVPARTALQILAEEGTDIMPGFNPEHTSLAMLCAGRISKALGAVKTTSKAKRKPPAPRQLRSQ